MTDAPDAQFVMPDEIQPFISARVRSDILALVDAFGAYHKLSDAKISARMCGDRNLLPRFRAASGSFSTKTADEIIAWLSVNWPADLAWPLHVARP